ncbi:Tetrahydroberberine oxidase [Linum grandiflorum]
MFCPCSRRFVVESLPTDDHSRFLHCLYNSTTLSTASDSVVTQEDNAYFNELSSSIQNLRFTTSTTNQPVVIVQPNETSQIGAVVLCAKANNLELRIRSGGHDYEGLSYTSAAPFILVDLIQLSEVTVDPYEKSAWIQAGATVGEVYYYVGRSIENNTLAFPAGISLTIGVGGHFSGGGDGTLVRYAGLAADHVTDVVLVDVDGQTRDRESLGEDVFWAIRGGGGNTFGVVAAWKVSLVTVPETVTVASVGKQIERTGTRCLLKWQKIADKLPDELFIRVVVYKVNTSNSTSLIAMFNIFYVGPRDEVMPLLEDHFPELGVTMGDLSEMTWGDYRDSIVLENLLIRTPRKGKTYFKGKSDFVTEPIPEFGLEGIWKQMLREDIELPFLIFTPYGGKMARIPETSIPFPHRQGNIFQIHYMTAYVSSNPRAAYINYRDIDIGEDFNPSNATLYERAKVWGPKYFKDNFYRLVTIKTIIDPTNFFKNEQSIPSLHGNENRHRQRQQSGTSEARSGFYLQTCCFFIFMFLVSI